ncbi:MAG TPA: hypothetical protein VGH20_10435 [Myxococcales bacterium]|jgi:hypothetical protein
MTGALLLLAGLALGGPSARAANDDRPVTFKPLFDVNKRLKKREIANLKFVVKDARGAVVPAAGLSFKVRHGTGGDVLPLRARNARGGAVEVPFQPGEPGAFWIFASLRARPDLVLPPIRVSVLGVVDGLVELPPSADVDVKRSSKAGWKGR